MATLSELRSSSTFLLMPPILFHNILELFSPILPTKSLVNITVFLLKSGLIYETIFC